MRIRSAVVSGAGAWAASVVWFAVLGLARAGYSHSSQLQLLGAFLMRWLPSMVGSPSLANSSSPSVPTANVALIDHLVGRPITSALVNRPLQCRSHLGGMNALRNQTEVSIWSTMKIAGVRGRGMANTGGLVLLRHWNALNLIPAGSCRP